MELKERLTLLVDKDGPDSFTQLMVEQILQLERIADSLDEGIVVYEGGPAVDEEEPDEPDPPF